MSITVLFQDMENKIRSTLNEIYFGKTKDIVNGLRYGHTTFKKNFYFIFPAPAVSSSGLLVLSLLQ